MRLRKQSVFEGVVVSTAAAKTKVRLLRMCASLTVRRDNRGVKLNVYIENALGPLVLVRSVS